MNDFTASLAKTDLAVGELIQAAAHQHGVVGPVPFTISRPKYYEWCGVDDNYAEAEEEKDAK